MPASVSATPTEAPNQPPRDSVRKSAIAPQRRPAMAIARSYQASGRQALSAKNGSASVSTIARMFGWSLTPCTRGTVGGEDVARVEALDAAGQAHVVGVVVADDPERVDGERQRAEHERAPQHRGGEEREVGEGVEDEDGCAHHECGLQARAPVDGAVRGQRVGGEEAEDRQIERGAAGQAPRARAGRRRRPRRGPRTWRGGRSCAGRR